MFKCTKCLEQKDEDNFYSSKGKRLTWCKKCHNQASSEARNRNKEADRQRQKRYREKRIAKNKERDPYAAGGTKRCPCCERSLPVIEFYISVVMPSGLDTYCKACAKRKSAGYKNNGYDISVEDHDKIMAKGKCDLCSETKNLAIDHNHKTGAIRGLLCFGHNTGLGKFNDSIEELEKAILYLKGIK